MFEKGKRDGRPSPLNEELFSPQGEHQRRVGVMGWRRLGCEVGGEYVLVWSAGWGLESEVMALVEWVRGVVLLCTPLVPGVLRVDWL